MKHRGRKSELTVSEFVEKVLEGCCYDSPGIAESAAAQACRNSSAIARLTEILVAKDILSTKDVEVICDECECRDEY